jgi:hypothetical protein
VSGFTPIPLTHFRHALKARGVSLGELADQIGRARHHVSQVLHGQRNGAEVWPLIRAVVTAEEWAILLHMEHCATWNTAQCDVGDTAMVWQMRASCAWCAAPDGFRACVRAMAGEVTHGLCPACYASERAVLKALGERKAS